MLPSPRHVFRACRVSCRTLLSANAVPIPGRMTLHTGAFLGLSVQEEVARSHYQVLGVKRNATKKEIRAAFVTLSKKYHPDSNPGCAHTKSANSGAFVEVSEAYHTLSNPKRRAQYDSELLVAETYRTQYEQRFYRGSSDTPNERPFKCREGDRHSSYSTGGGHSYQYYRSEMDWNLYDKKHKHARLVYMLLVLTVTVPALFMLRVNHNYHKYYKPSAIIESQRNTAAYMAVRDRARNSSVQDQLDLLVRRHGRGVETARDVDSGPPNR